MDAVGRLAPTPSGHLHLGNALAFGAAWLSVRAREGELLLRVEDVDRGRARSEIAQSQRSDLQWLGLAWDREVPAQSERDYEPWLARLSHRIYRCSCSRKELKRVAGRCDCHSRDHESGAVRFALEPGEREIHDRGRGPRKVDASALFPDPVLRRRDGVFAYNLAVVADDIADGVTEVVRGGDLLDYSAVQEQIWEALGAAPPSWMHTPLVVGADGRKLSKSFGSAEIRELRAMGWDPDRVWGMVLSWLGLEGPLDRALAQWEATSRWPPQVVSSRR